MKGVKYKEVFFQAEKEFSAYNFEFANTEVLLKNFETTEKNVNLYLKKNFHLPAYDQCLKASHIFNLLDARGVIGVAERTGYITRIRELAKGCGALWLSSQNLILWLNFYWNFIVRKFLLNYKLEQEINLNNFLKNLLKKKILNIKIY
jgi:glycyl-tRNA synthetase alpha subunit